MKTQCEARVEREDYLICAYLGVRCNNEEVEECELYKERIQPLLRAGVHFSREIKSRVTPTRAFYHDKNGNLKKCSVEDVHRLIEMGREE